MDPPAGADDDGPMRSRSCLLGLLLGLAPGCGGDDDGPAPGPDAGLDAAVIQCSGGDVADLLAEIPGLTATERESDEPGYRAFDIEYDQPADHAQPDGARFVQHLTLLHTDCEAAMVLHTTGYHGSQGAYLAEPTALLAANQIDVEQRFFEPSRPEPADWSLLTIEQAAADHHRIALALRPIYGGAWVSTGASKGGMTSIYHRRFYPDDVDATVAYVAPLSFGAPDDSYHPFFDTVGGEACRAALRDFQRELLLRREPLLALMQADGDEQGITFERLGGIEGAFEDAVIEFPWGFWQYGGGGTSMCDLVPAPEASDGELYDFFAVVGGSVFFVSDQVIEIYSPYYFQAETQLGFPSSPRAHIEDLLEAQEAPRDYLPEGVTATYDEGEAMRDIDEWVQGEAERLLFVYGEWDPWYAGAFELGAAVDSFLYVAPELDHGAGIADLAEADRDAALDALARWTGETLRAPGRERARPAPPPPVMRPR